MSARASMSSPALMQAIRGDCFDNPADAVRRNFSDH
jgi:hypothetical protein